MNIYTYRAVQYLEGRGGEGGGTEGGWTTNILLRRKKQQQLPVDLSVFYEKTIQIWKDSISSRFRVGIKLTIEYAQFAICEYSAYFLWLWPQSRLLFWIFSAGWTPRTGSQPWSILLVCGILLWQLLFGNTSSLVSITALRFSGMTTVYAVIKLYFPKSFLESKKVNAIISSVWDSIWSGHVGHIWEYLEPEKKNHRNISECKLLSNRLGIRCSHRPNVMLEQFVECFRFLLP